MATKSEKKIKNLKKIKSKYERNFKFSKLRLFIFLILVVAIGCTYFVKTPIENFVADVLQINIENTEHGSVVTMGDLEVHYIDVGQGESIAIRFPDSKTMIIDGGDKDARNNLLSYLNQEFFKNDSDKEFDYALLTHNDSDHCGSLDDVYKEFQVNISIRPYAYSTISEYETTANGYGGLAVTSVVYKDYIDAIYEENDVADDSDIIYAHAGLKITSDDPSVNYLMEFLTPKEKYYSNPNDYSPFVLLEYEGKSFLFTGDAANKQFEELDELIASNATIASRLSRVTVYNAAHHGAYTENSNKVSTLEKLKPEYVVISCGIDNKYHHPAVEFLSALSSLNVNVDPNNIYRTDLNKNIVFGVSHTDSSLNIVSDVEVDPNASYVGSNDAKVILYYSWWILAGILVFVCFILCFYNYGYSKRNKKVRAYEEGK